VSRADQRSVAFHVPLADLGLAPGVYSFQARSSWVGRRGCAAPRGARAPCVDFAPDAGGAGLRVVPVRPVGCYPARAELVTGAPHAGMAVALTFDDGPSPDTAPLLDALERAQAPATFFVLGREIAGREELLRREIRDGDAVGDHSWSHPRLAGGGSFAEQQLSSTKQAIEKATGFTPCLFRAPYGDVSANLVGEAGGLGLTTIQWNVDPRDWSMPGTSTIVQRVTSAVRPGSIVIMHDGGGPREQTVEAVPRIVAALRARGYRFETVPALLGGGMVYAR
jgi:peptidoglycan/xylan/chitin deacetylase (PgdA/CDA1 family)